ncbi:MAG TPA: iron ABC transporter permease [Burkholderiales bacterium]|nr:iron ABC transporter permease [Burkholderiales bacterium]
MRRLGALGVAALVISAVVALPVLSVLSSVASGGGDAWRHIASVLLARYAWTTLVLSFGVALGVVSMGVITAWLVTMYRFRGRDVLEWTLVLPLAMPAYVMAYAYTDWLQFAGPVQSALRAWTGWGAQDYWFPDFRSLWGAALILALALYPYVYIVARSAFAELSRSALEAARLAGLTRRQTFVRVGIPLARPAIAAGTSLALMETLADFGTVSYFGLEVFTTGIFKAWFSMGDRVAAAQLSSCLLLFVALLVALERASRGRAAYHEYQPRRAAPPHRLHGARAATALLLCGAPVLFGFLLPAALLGWLAIDSAAYSAARLPALIANSFGAAALTAVLAVALGTTMAYAARLTKSGAVAAANRVASLGYAVPGAVIAVGILAPLGVLDNVVAGWIEAATGQRTGLLLTGTIAALIFAYLVRLLAVALQTTEAGLARITPSMGDAARSLGLTPGATLRRVHVPLLRSSLATAALLVFVDVLKELPATFALRPFNFDTLAIEAYNLAKDERLAEAAAPSLVIVAVALVPVVMASRRYFQATRS